MCNSGIWLISDDSEIDVVSVGDEINEHSAPSEDDRSQYHITGASSMRAQVNAMHNYSSQQAGPVKASRSAGSSAQSLCNSSHIPSAKSTRRKDKRYRSQRAAPYAPATPATTKRKQKNVDMHKVAQRLDNMPASHHTNSSAVSASECEHEEHEGKREQHNVLERSRRMHLKQQFDDLRLVVPDICKNDKTPKVLILKKAEEYIKDLMQEHSNLCRVKKYEHKRHEDLLARLYKIRAERNVNQSNS